MHKNTNKSKDSFRCDCLARLKKASKNIGRKTRDKHIIAKLYNIVKATKVQTIMLYIPLDIEVDINPLIIKLRKEKKSHLCAFYGR